MRISRQRGVRQPTAYFAPLLGWLLAIASWFGADTVRWHRLLACVIGTTSVVVAAYLAREIAGAIAGVVAAFLVAIHPLLFGADATLMAESLYIPLVGLCVWLVYRVLRTRRLGWSAALGACIGYAALTRADGLGLLLVLVAPLAWSLRRKGTAWLQHVGLIVLVTALVIAPWTIRNAATFDHPVLIATDSGTVLAGAYCDTAFYGANTGRWMLGCPDAPDIVGDESTINDARREIAFDYARAHLARLPVVVAFRVGRTWIPPHSSGQSAAEVDEGRDQHWQWLGEVLYLLLLPFVIVGVVALRRRRVPVWRFLRRSCS